MTNLSNDIDISVITSVYNTEKYLEKCVNSVLKQTFSNFEFIIINNGSTDHSLDILKKYAEKDKRIVIINNTTNRMLSSARNQGIEISKGKYLYFIDSDDFIEPDTLECLFECAERNNLDLVVFGRIMEYQIKSKTMAIPVIPEYGLFNDVHDFRTNCMKYLKQTILTVPWNKLFKKEIIDEFQIRFPPVHLEDHHFNMEYLRRVNSAEFLNKAFYHYRRDRIGSQLNKVHSFDLYQRKKEHFLHTRDVLLSWHQLNGDDLNILNSFFSERVVECVMEIVYNKSFTFGNKLLKIKNILNDDVFIKAINCCKCDNKIMQFLLFPLKKKMIKTTFLECKIIGFFKFKFYKYFIMLKAKLVNRANQKYYE